MKKNILLAALLIVVAIGGALLYRADEQPNFQEIVSLSSFSGLHFQVPPKPIRWSTEASGPFKNNQLEIVEFQVDPADAASISKCDAPGFQRGVPSTSSMFIGMAAQPTDLSTVCWRTFEHEGIHFFAVFDGVLVYRLVII